MACTARRCAGPLGAAGLFGVSTPLVQRAGLGIGPFTTAALLYGGAVLVGVLLRRPVERETKVQAANAARLAWMALSGTAIGPAALARPRNVAP